MKTKGKTIAVATLRLVLLSTVCATWAYAQGLGATPPITMEDGVAGCSTCLTEAAGVNAIGASDIPAGTINNVDKLHADIKSGPDGTKVVTLEGSATANRCLQTDDDGDAVVASGACAVANGAPYAFTSATLLSDGNTTVYVSLSGAVSTSATDIRAQSVVGAGTLRNLRIVLSQNCSSCTATLRKGTCGGTLSDTSVTVTPATANTPVADTTNNTTTTANQCVQVGLAKTSAAADFYLIGHLDKTSD